MSMFMKSFQNKGGKEKFDRGKRTEKGKNRKILRERKSILAELLSKYI